jgi:hypothetical protein
MRDQVRHVWQGPCHRGAIDSAAFFRYMQAASARNADSHVTRCVRVADNVTGSPVFGLPAAHAIARISVTFDVRITYRAPKKSEATAQSAVDRLSSGSPLAVPGREQERPDARDMLCAFESRKSRSRTSNRRAATTK